MAFQTHQCCSYSSFLSVLPSILVCIIGVCLFMKRSKSRRPPGPRGLPIIGHLHLLGQLPHQSLYELSKAHGPLMWLRLGHIPVVVASSPDMARLILKEHDVTFADRRPTAVGKHVFDGTKGMVFSSAVSPHWKLLRRISATELFSFKQIDRFRPVRADEARALMCSIFADCDQTAGSGLCSLRPKLLQAMSNLTMRMMAGSSLPELAGDDAASIINLIEQVPKLLGTFNVGDYLPFMAWMDLQGCERRSKKVADGLREAFDRIVQARRTKAVTAARNKDAHLLDALLEYADSSSTPISIMGNFVELFVGGTDTTAVTIEWALAELLRNADKLQLAQAEIEQVVGRERLVEEDDIAQLPYLVACVKEAMRLHPAVPLLMPHGTSQACQVMGFEIPAETQAYVNAWAIGRDAQIWENPLQFLPERFLKADPIDVQGQNFELLPFGSGRRICPGYRLAIPITNLFLASLLQGFEWTLPASHQQPDMTELFGAITSMKTPLLPYANPRLPKELYTSQ